MHKMLCISAINYQSTKIKNTAAAFARPLCRTHRHSFPGDYLAAQVCARANLLRRIFARVNFFEFFSFFESRGTCVFE